MSYVSITALTYPEGTEAEVERRFAARKHAVDQEPGFVSFQLLRPVKGETRYFVTTTWESRQHFEQWLEKREASASAHAKDREYGREGMSVDLLGFEVVEPGDS